MNHNTIHELLALRLYGETSAEEDLDITRHLDDCASCRDFAAQLETSLGRLPREPLRLRSKPRVSHMYAARLAAATALLGFLAGSMFNAAPQPTPHNHLTEIMRTTQVWADLPAGETPPLVNSGGRLSRLGAYLRK